jgi:hypothetical protein
MKVHDNLIKEERSTERVQLSGYTVDFVDINCSSSVTITDVSNEGLRMIKVPRKLAYKETPTDIIVSGDLLSVDCHLTIMPCWRKKGAIYWDVGFYIHRPPYLWKKFVRLIKIRNR